MDIYQKAACQVNKTLIRNAFRLLAKSGLQDQLLMCKLMLHLIMSKI